MREDLGAAPGRATRHDAVSVCAWQSCLLMTGRDASAILGSTNRYGKQRPSTALHEVRWCYFSSQHHETGRRSLLSLDDCAVQDCVCARPQRARVTSWVRAVHLCGFTEPVDETLQEATQRLKRAESNTGAGEKPRSRHRSHHRAIVSSGPLSAFTALAAIRCGGRSAVRGFQRRPALRSNHRDLRRCGLAAHSPSSARQRVWGPMLTLACGPCSNVRHLRWLREGVHRAELRHHPQNSSHSHPSTRCARKNEWSLSRLLCVRFCTSNCRRSACRGLYSLCSHPDDKKAKLNEAENDVAEAEALVSILCSSCDRGSAWRFVAARSSSSHARALPCAQIRRMDLEARSLPAGVKTPLLNKLKDYKVRGEKKFTFLERDLRPWAPAILSILSCRFDVCLSSESVSAVVSLPWLSQSHLPC